MSCEFIHLRAHSEYSLVDGLLRIKPLVAAVARAGMPAVALTDQSNLFAMVKFYKAALAAGVKPIVGVDAWLHNNANANKPFRLVLLVQDSVGYRNLTRLVSRSYREGQHLGVPMLQRAWLEKASQGLIVLSGGRDGDVGRCLLSGSAEQARAVLRGWLDLLGDRYYLEVHRTGREGEEECLDEDVGDKWKKRGISYNDIKVTLDPVSQSITSDFKKEIREVIRRCKTEIKTIFGRNKIQANSNIFCLSKQNKQ